MGEQKSVIRDTAKFFLGTFGANGINIFQNFFLANSLGPATFGLWNLLMTALSYNLHAHMGLIHGMTKEVPTLRGMGEHVRAREIEAVCFTAVCFIEAIIFTAIIVLSFYSWGDAFRGLSASLRILAFLMVFNQIYIFLVSVLRNDKKFSILSYSIFALPALTLLFLVQGVMLFSNKLEVALLSMLIAHCLVSAYIIIKGKYMPGFRLDIGILKNSFKVGIPILAFAIGFTIFLTVDRWILAKMIDAKYLGYYAMGIMFVGGLYSIPAVLSYVLYPRMLEAYGEKRTFSASEKYTYHPIVLTTYLMTWITGVAALVIPLIIYYLMPVYAPGLTTITILIVGSFFISPLSIFTNYLFSVNLQNSLLKIQAAAIVFISVLDYLILKADFGVEAMSVGTVISYAIYGMMVLWKGFSVLFGDKKKALAAMSAIYLIFISSIFVFQVISNVLPVNGRSLCTDLTNTAVQFFIFTGFLLLFYPYINRITGISGHLSLLIPVKYRWKAK